MAVLISSSIINNKEEETIPKFNLKRHGFCIFKKVLNNNEVNALTRMTDNIKIKKYLLTHSRINDVLKSATSVDYFYDDSVTIISPLKFKEYTNSEFNKRNKKWPVYKCVIYLEDAKKPFGNMHDIKNIDRVKYLFCKQGDVIFFEESIFESITNTEDKKIVLTAFHKNDYNYSNTFRIYANEDF